MTGRDKKLCVDCEERPRWGKKTLCYACYGVVNPEYVERDLAYKRYKYHSSLAERQRRNMESYQSKCRTHGRLNDE